jgi:hypothetical protein
MYHGLVREKNGWIRNAGKQKDSWSSEMGFLHPELIKYRTEYSE